MKSDELHLNETGLALAYEEFKKIADVVESKMPTPQEALQWSEDLQQRLIGFDEDKDDAPNLMGEAACLLKLLSATHSPNDSPSAESDVAKNAERLAHLAKVAFQAQKATMFSVEEESEYIRGFYSRIDSAIAQSKQGS